MKTVPLKANKKLAVKPVSLNVNVDPDIKEKATEIFKSLGFSRTAAVGAFLRQVIFIRGFPFDLKVPDKLTLEAFEQLESGQGITSANIEEFRKKAKTWK